MDDHPWHPAHSDTQHSVPVLFVVLAEAEQLAKVVTALERRFGSDYEILGCTTGAECLARLSERTAAGKEAALVIAGRRLTDLPGAVGPWRASSNGVSPAEPAVFAPGRGTGSARRKQHPRS